MGTDKVSEQLNLFESIKPQNQPRSQDLVMSRSALVQWKRKIYDYQQSLRNNPPPQQQSLFPDRQKPWDADSLDPFNLPTHPDQFYELPQYQHSQTCLYFILDTAVPLLLYVGQTVRSPKQRWQQHYCRDYLRKYVGLHRQYKLEVTVRSAFWWGVPKERKLRQRLEKELILKWRSCLNQESWRWWKQPFKS